MFNLFGPKKPVEEKLSDVEKAFEELNNFNKKQEIDKDIKRKSHSYFKFRKGLNVLPENYLYKVPEGSKRDINPHKLLTETDSFDLVLLEWVKKKKYIDNNMQQEAIDNFINLNTHNNRIKYDLENVQNKMDDINNKKLIENKLEQQIEINNIYLNKYKEIFPNPETEEKKSTSEGEPTKEDNT